MTIFVDTWGWVALKDEKDDRFHVVSHFVQEAFERGERLCTTDYVVDETLSLLYANLDGRRGERILDELLDLLKLDQFMLEWIGKDRFDKAVHLRRRYRDKPKISFTDLTSMVVMTELGITDILTADRHFEQVNLGFRRLPES